MDLRFAVLVGKFDIDSQLLFDYGPVYRFSALTTQPATDRRGSYGLPTFTKYRKQYVMEQKRL